MMIIWDWVVTATKWAIIGLIYAVSGQWVLALLYYMLLVGFPLFFLRLYLGEDVLGLKAFVAHMIGLDLILSEKGMEA